MSSKKISCVKCNRQFRSARGYAEHQRRVHGYVELGPRAELDIGLVGSEAQRGKRSEREAWADLLERARRR